ncbi:hypothetical protein CcaverHIS631_0100230 [Cutaneotrichosporon cavernicola]|nr:hypothetical protein CcaverHIS631_0100230 [Cutaneotrichosporon cavernicola]
MEFQFSATRPSVDFPRSPTLVDVPCQYTYLTGEMTTDRRARSERIPSATYSIHSRSRSRTRSREPSAVSVPAGSMSGLGATRLVARIQALLNPREPDQFSSSHSPAHQPPRRSRFFTNMSRRSWFVKEDKTVVVDANALSGANASDSSRTDAPAVVVNTTTVRTVKPLDGPTITLTADQLLRSGSNPGTPTLSRSTSRVYQVNAADFGKVNQTQS